LILIGATAPMIDELKRIRVRSRRFPFSSVKAQGVVVVVVTLSVGVWESAR